ncbi:hypothetical protein DV735_g5572, partial [Chaetothyriales sp. CBS 134920]
MELFYKLRDRFRWTLLLAGLIWLGTGIVWGNSVSRYGWRPVALSWGVALALRASYTWLVFPYFLDPLRHLPSLTTLDFRDLLPVTIMERGKRPLEWVKRWPGSDLINIRVLGFGSVVLLVSPQAHRDVLNTHAADFVKPEGGRNYLRGILGDGLILVEGPEHKRQRRLLDPSFKIQNIRALQVLIAEKSEIMMESMLAESRKTGHVEIASWGSRFTLDIIGPALMSTDFQALTTKDNELERAFANLIAPSLGQSILFLLNLVLPSSVVRRIPCQTNRMLAQNTSIVQAICSDILDQKMATFTSNTESKDATADILGSIISNGELNKKELVDQMVTFLGAGHETTASSIAWVTHLLTLPKYHHYQTKVRDEVRSALQQAGHTDLNQALSWEILDMLPLVNGICEETLRLFPPVTNTARKAIRDSRVAGRHFPKDTVAIIMPWVTNRNPDFWGADAEDMVPERWISKTPDGARRLNKSGGATSNMCIQTFLHGHRACIGRELAKAELRTFVAVFFTRFTVRRLPGDNGDIVPAGSLTIKPAGGLKVWLQPYKASAILTILQVITTRLPYLVGASEGSPVPACSIATNMNPHNQPVQRQDNGNSVGAISRLALPAYVPPFPGIYPLPVPPQPVGQLFPMHTHPGPPYLPQQIHPAAQVPALRSPYPNPPAAISQRPPPPGVSVLSPQCLPTTEEMRYKCSVCGRFRSTKYHYKHPIPPGQLPSKTVCGRCWDEATGSEDSETADETQERRYRQLSSTGRLSRAVSTRAARSRSTVKYSDEEEYDYYQSGVPVQDGAVLEVSGVQRPMAYQGYVRGSLTPGPGRQADAFNGRAPHRQSVNVPWSRNARPETGLTALNLARRSVASGRLSDADWENNFHNEDTSSSCPSYRRRSQSQDGRRSRRPGSRTSQSRYRNESRVQPRRRSNSTDYYPPSDEEPDHLPPPSSREKVRSRRRDAGGDSRVRSISRSDLESRTLREDGEVEAIDRLTLADDYEYYDKDGMRVTVREI